MAGTSTTRNKASHFWPIVKDWSAEDKIELIAKLSTSLCNSRHTDTRTPSDKDGHKTAVRASDFYGIWEEDGIDLAAFLKEERRFSKEDEEL